MQLVSYPIPSTDTNVDLDSVKLEKMSEGMSLLKAVDH